VRAPAPAKINLALVVGPQRAADGKHEVATVLQRIDVADRVAIAPGARLSVTGFADDTIVRDALVALGAAAGVEPLWAATITKRIPVAAGLGGGSSDAATALRLANETLAAPLVTDDLRTLAATLGADVPFFLGDGPQLGCGDGSVLEPLALPQDYWIVLVLPDGAAKESTAAVYAAFDERDGGAGWEERRTRLDTALAEVRRPRDLAALPPNDLVQPSPHAQRLLELGAFRADVSGAGPAVYGLFLHRAEATAAERELRGLGRTWITVPTWYG
jgi:4-diphosphocytidyl-2-C-methyl-D-erythritol kinase